MLREDTHMDKESIIRKLDEGVDALRGLLAENEGSTLKTIASSAKQSFNSLKATFKENEKAQTAIAEIKTHLDELEKSIKAGDKKLSAKLLTAAEKKIRKYREKHEDKGTAKVEVVKAKAGAKTDAGKGAAQKTVKSDKPEAAKTSGKTAPKGSAKTKGQVPPAKSSAAKKS